MHTQTDTLTQIRQHLTSKSAGELVDLLMDLLQQTDETTRRRFWEQLVLLHFLTMHDIIKSARP
jgi:hypothetical protein